MTEVCCEFRVPSANFPRETLWHAEFSARGLRRLAVMLRKGPVHAATSAACDPRCKDLREKLAARLNGKDAGFDWTQLDLEGHPEFHRRVWKAMCQIPFGSVATYAEVAARAGSPLAFRACGQACGANPILVFIPCHRVVAAHGLGGFGCGLDWKKRLLAAERIDYRAIGSAGDRRTKDFRDAKVSHLYSADENANFDVKLIKNVKCTKSH